MAKKDIRIESMLTWNKYTNTKFEDALPSIYSTVNLDVVKYTGWYWVSIKTKRNTSLLIRSATILFFGLGALFPLASGLSNEPISKLYWTQLGVISLVLGGLLHTADRIFGWSSGWIRYISTVTAMEYKAKQFEIAWAEYILQQGSSLNNSDIKPLFDLAAQLQKELIKLQVEETENWKAEFNMGTLLLGDLIKSKLESTEKIKNDLENAANTAITSQHCGALSIFIAHKNNLISPITIIFDTHNPEEFIGTSWSRIDVPPGLHSMRIISNISTPPITIDKVFLIKPGEVTTSEVVIP